MQKNVASQSVAASLVALADGSPVTTGTTTVYIIGDTGSQFAGIGTVAHKGNGTWTYLPAQSETNYDLIAFTFANTLAVSNTVNVATTPVRFNKLSIDTNGKAAATIATGDMTDLSATRAAKIDFLTATPPTAATIASTVMTSLAGIGITNSWVIDVDGQATSAATNALTAASQTTTLLTQLSGLANALGADFDTLDGEIEALGAAVAAIDTSGGNSGSVDEDLIARAVWSNGNRTLTTEPPIAVPAQQFRSRSIVRGNAYGPGARAFTITQATGAEWPTALDDWTWALKATKPADNFNTGSASFTANAAVSGSSLNVTLPAATTLAAAVGQYHFSVRGVNIDDPTKIFTVELGILSVLEDPSAT